MALAFKGFSLIKLNRAVDATTGEDAFTYEVTIHDHFGRTSNKSLKVNTVDRDWCKLRMEGDRFAVMVSGVCRPITEDEYVRLVG